MPRTGASLKDLIVKMYTKLAAVCQGAIIDDAYGLVVCQKRAGHSGSHEASVAGNIWSWG